MNGDNYLMHCLINIYTFSKLSALWFPLEFARAKTNTWVTMKMQCFNLTSN